VLASGSILIICTLAWTARQGVLGFVGDHGQGVTPVPISNTEVKPLSPMILLSGKVGYRRLCGPPQVIPGEALFFFALRFSCAAFIDDGTLAQFAGSSVTAETAALTLTRQVDSMIWALDLLSPEKCCLLDPCRRV
jgi:hypothetical protein